MSASEFVVALDIGIDDANLNTCKRALRVRGIS
jgi:hypothetical protein